MRGPSRAGGRSGARATGVVVIAESHLTFHSFVEKDYFFFDSKLNAKTKVKPGHGDEGDR